MELVLVEQVLLLLFPRLEQMLFRRASAPYFSALNKKLLSSSLNFINKKERMSNRTKIVAIPKTTTTTFSPTSIAGCQLWLDGTDPAGNGVIPANDATVSTWVDKSGLVNNATTYSGITTYSTSLKALFFSNSGFQTSIVTPTNRVGSGFFVVRATVNSGNVVFQGSGLGYGGRQFRNDNGTILKTIKENIVEMFLAGPTVLNTLMLVGYVDDGNNLTHCLNGTLYTTTTATTFTEGRTILIGKSFNGEHLIGYIHEVVLFNINVTTTQRQQVESYLAQKWGLTSSLAAGHPGLTTTVYTITVTVPKQKISSIPKTIFVSFLPTSITGCALWMDGADPAGNGVVPANGATVSTWADKSGSGNNASGGVSPTYNSSQRAITFNGSSWLTTSYSCVPTNETAFVVFQTTSSAVQANCFMIGPSAIGGRLIMSVNENDGFGLSFKIGAYGVANGSRLSQLQNQIYLGTTTVASTTSYVYLNGTQGPSSTLTYSGSGTTQIGTANSGSAIYIGYIYEIIIYNTALTNTQRQSVESYLAQKWGLTSSLPAGHPGLTTTVYGTTTAAPTVRQKIRALPPPVLLVSYTQAFAYTGANQTFAVPATTTSITLYMWGAGGGGGHTGTQGATAGGAGAYVQGTLTVSPNSSLTIIVGGGGAHGSVGVAYGGGGSAAAAAYGGGGGRSAIQLSGTELVDAGGGGGAGYDCSGGHANFSPTINGGAGYPGLTGASWPFDSGGGGTQTAGGAAGPGNASSYGTPQPGTYLAGGLAAAYAGAGGSGYYGGGGGNTNDTNGAGGGGGSSYTTNAAFTLIAGSNSSNGYSAPASASSYYVSGVAAGSTNMSSGGNGRIVLVYMA
jgi:hypothetical protein